MLKVTTQNFLCRLRASAVLLGLLLAVSCTHESFLSDEGGQEATTVRFNVSPLSGMSGADMEIKTLRIIAFDTGNGVCVYNGTVDRTPANITILSGNRDFYFIANEPSSLSTGLNAIKTYNALKDVTIPTGNLADGTAFVAFGSLMNQRIRPGQSNTISVSESLKRLAVKVNLRLNGQNQLTPTQVVFKNLPDVVPLFDETLYEPATGATTTKEVTIFTDASLETGLTWVKTASDIVLPSYLFTPKDDADKAVGIEVTLDNGKTVKGSLCRTNTVDNSKDYTLPRNTVFSLVCNVKAGDLEIITTVANWDEKNQDNPAGGSYWVTAPKSVRVGLDGTDTDATATFTAKITTIATSTPAYHWYRRIQHPNMSYTTEELQEGADVTITTGADNVSTLTIRARRLEDSGEIYCRGEMNNGAIAETLESEKVTLMVVGTELDPDGNYPEMQNWTPPRNALPGATCLLRDSRDNKLYRVKLMADGNWWTIMDLAYGNPSSEEDYENYANSGVDNPARTNTDGGKPTELNVLGGGYTYGMAVDLQNPTGGLLYNCHAALQLPGDRNDEGDESLKKEFLPSICPEGWHLPGNLYGEFNYEWQNLINHNIDDLALFDYNSPHDFNAYTKDSYEDAYYYHGGYKAAAYKFRYPITYWTFSIRQDEIDGITVQTDEKERLGNSNEVPIRCVLNFTK